MDAPRGSVEFEESDELERLRRRAYGPDADIAGDAAAQARLSELEAAQRRQQTPVVNVAARGAAPVSECVPVPQRVRVSEPVDGSRSASTSVRQPVDGAFVEHEPAGVSVTEHYPAEGPIADTDAIDGAPAAPLWRRRRQDLPPLAGVPATCSPSRDDSSTEKRQAVRNALGRPTVSHALR
jgi:hypothetical protein